MTEQIEAQLYALSACADELKRVSRIANKLAGYDAARYDTLDEYVAMALEAASDALRAVRQEARQAREDERARRQGARANMDININDWMEEVL